MRNSILGVLGEMILRVLSGEDLDAKQKSTRDQFLDKLEVLWVQILVLLLASFMLRIYLQFTKIFMKVLRSFTVTLDTGVRLPPVPEL